jgi:GAF domain-containing protein
MTDPQLPDDAETSAQRREQALADTFVHLADTMVDDYDVADLLRGNLALVASSSQEMRLLELFQLQNNEGPCLDCVRTGAAVTSSDLDEDRDRWPLFVPAAHDAGFRSVAAVPMRLRDQIIGGLNLFMDVPRAVSSVNRRLAQALADVATIGILQQRSLHRSHVLSEQLQTALTSRIVIEQAKGILAERSGLTMDDAFAALRRHARDNNLKLTDVATAVVTTGLDPTHD